MTCLCKQIAGNDIKLSSICIGNLWIFDNFSPEDVETITRKAFRKKTPKGQILFLQGDPAEEVFLIKGGRIKLTKLLKNGTELMLDLRKAGDFVGENMFSEAVEYPVTAVCIEDTLTCGFTRSQFQELVLSRPTVGLQVIKTLSERISRLTARMGTLGVSNLEDRLYQVLNNVAKKYGAESPRGHMIHFPLTHEDLSFLTGVHRGAIIRAMGTLRKSGKIVFENRMLILPAFKAA